MAIDRAKPDRGLLARRATMLAKGLIEQARQLGNATLEAGLSEPGTCMALHDLRGGGLKVLLGTEELLSYLGQSEGLTHWLEPLTRRPGRTPSVTLWTNGRGCDAGPRGPGTVTVHNSFRGDISVRCLETASIDRVVYNLMKNSARFAVDARADLVVSEVSPGLTRWAVSNRVDAAEAEFLAHTDLKVLFASGVMWGGNGQRLANCADVVADCFSLPSAEDAARGGYVGAALRGDSFVAWFHWPAYSPGRESA